MTVPVFTSSVPPICLPSISTGVSRRNPAVASIPGQYDFSTTCLEGHSIDSDRPSNREESDFLPLSPPHWGQPEQASRRPRNPKLQLPTWLTSRGHPFQATDHINKWTLSRTGVRAVTLRCISTGPSPGGQTIEWRYDLWHFARSSRQKDFFGSRGTRCPNSPPLQNGIWPKDISRISPLRPQPAARGQGRVGGRLLSH